MSGERRAIVVPGERATVLARAVEALGRFPSGQPWVLIGGLAVFVRVGSITRPTADADTVARSQSELLRELVDSDPTAVVTGGEVQMAVGDGTVDVDVMDLADDPLPLDAERRAFALARRGALMSAVTERIVVTGRDHAVVADAEIPVATVGALISLKTVSMVRRPHSNHPQKVGSDIHDLVRLVSSVGALTAADEVVALDHELASWVADQIGRAFGSDLRYTLIRLHNNDRSPAARALTDDDVAATVILADALHVQLGRET